jgi:hypothetical protein
MSDMHPSLWAVFGLTCCPGVACAFSMAWFARKFTAALWYRIHRNGFSTRSTLSTWSLLY